MKYTRVKQHDATYCITLAGTPSLVFAWVEIEMNKFQATDAPMEGLV